MVGAPVPIIRRDGTYLVTGGFGALWLWSRRGSSARKPRVALFRLRSVAAAIERLAGCRNPDENRRFEQTSLTRGGSPGFDEPSWRTGARRPSPRWRRTTRSSHSRIGNDSTGRGSEITGAVNLHRLSVALPLLSHRDVFSAASSSAARSGQLRGGQRVPRGPGHAAGT